MVTIHTSTYTYIYIHPCKGCFEKRQKGNCNSKKKGVQIAKVIEKPFPSLRG